MYEMGAQRRDLTVTFAQLFVHAFDRAQRVHCCFRTADGLETGRSVAAVLILALPRGGVHLIRKEAGGFMD